MEAAHDHSAHNGTMAAGGDKYGSHDSHGGVLRHPDGTYYYAHGAFLGHLVPGLFFIVWGTWWTLAGFQFYIRSLSSGGKQLFTVQAWYRWPWAPRRLELLPLEPFIKVALPLLGIMGELWAGHESYRRLVAANGMFEVDNLNDWQHSSMYLAFVTSGVIDLLGHFTKRLPAMAEQAFLALAFVVQLLLLVFHLKGPAIEVMVHLILGLQVAATIIAILASCAAPHSILLASARPFFTILQGVWWIQTAYIMYTGDPKWDPEYMGSTMMAPVMLAVHMLWIAFAMVLVLLGMQILNERLGGQPLPLPGAAPGGAAGGGKGGLLGHDSEVMELDMEMSSLIGHKHMEAEHRRFAHDA